MLQSKETPSIPGRLDRGDKRRNAAAYHDTGLARSLSYESRKAYVRAKSGAAPGSA
jgi:hypothetical protein